MKTVLITLALALIPLSAMAGIDAYEPPQEVQEAQEEREEREDARPALATAVGQSGYQLYELAAVSLRPETTIDDDGVHATVYRDDLGRKMIDERFVKDSIISKKYFNADGSVKETIFYIYDTSENLIKTVHRYQDGSETIF